MSHRTLIETFSPTTEEMTSDELDVVFGGTWLTERIHIDYHNLNNFNDPTAVRLA